MLASTNPPAISTTGNEIPKKDKIAVPATSTKAKKSVVLTAILRASSRLYWA